MTPLRAAVSGAQDFHDWAAGQGADPALLLDQGPSRVTVSQIFDEVEARVDAGTYDQLVIYFSGHGILLAPGAEYWLLSRAPDNPNEAVNLARSVEEARNSGIPHVVFISDACRSSVSGPPLSGVTGGVIFPNRDYRQGSAEIDIFYATRPGDPAYEVPEAEAVERYRGLFTDNLLAAVKAPRQEWIESVAEGTTTLAVVTSRKLKPHLEEIVPVDAATVDVKLRQQPDVRVETALPKFFAVAPEPSDRAREPAAPPPSGTRGGALTALRNRVVRAAPAPTAGDAALADELGLTAEVEHLVSSRGRERFETRTGFTVFGAKSVRVDALRWHGERIQEPGDDPEAYHVRLNPTDSTRQPSSIVFEFDRQTGTVLPVLPGFVGTVVVEDGRIVSVNYVPSGGTDRYLQYLGRADELEELKAVAAVAARNGYFFVSDQNPSEFAGRVRQAKGIDPTLGLYAAYAYAQVGRFKDAYSVYTYMKNDEIELPVPFDVLMLATRFKHDADKEPAARFAPFAPMLSQGWSLLMPDDPLQAPLHERLRPHLVPSLWTTLDLAGVRLARREVRSGRVA
jgi:Caspase domain